VLATAKAIHKNMR